MKTIWCLFSISNAYDQPDNNLVVWQSEKPTIPELAAYIQVKFPSDRDEITLAVVNIWSGKGSEIDNTFWRLEEVAEKQQL
jgi:hypothetical protein